VSLHWQGLALLASAIALVACSPVTVAPEQRQVMRIASPELLLPKAPKSSHAWHLLPVRLPAYMDRDELLLPRNSGVYASGARWAELPSHSANRVLAHDLATLLGANQLLTGTLPANTSARALRVEITAFDVRADGQAIDLQARWQISDPANAQGLAVHQTSLSVPVPADKSGGSTVSNAATQLDAVAQAHRLALSRLARSIAASLP
jgi:uncharacterized lipoprotein YmbA